MSTPASGCPLSKLMRILYIHWLLILSVLGISVVVAGGRSGNGKCPFSRTLAFQAPSTASGGGGVISSTTATNSVSGSHFATCRYYVAPTLGSASNRLPTSTFPRLERGESAGSVNLPRKSRIIRMATIEDTTATAPVKEEKAAKAGGEKKKKQDTTTPLQVHVIGLSHHNAAVEVRERLAVPEALWNAESAALCENPNIEEAAVLSTCNRFEVYVASADSRSALQEAVSHLQKRSGLDMATLRKSLFMLSAEDAVWHILRVSAGLDSLVVGEGQILSQVRQCYLHSTEEEGFAGKVVARLLNTAVSAGKRVRSETSISKGAVSISSAAAEFSKFRSEADLKMLFQDVRLTIVGAGTMSRLLLIHLQSLGVKAVTLVNRSMPKCEELVEEFPEIAFDVRLSDRLEETLMESDIVYTSTSSTGCIVTQPQLESIGAGKTKPIMFVDISVPRNVESQCNNVDGVFAYDVDDLKMVVARNTALRRREMLEAESILQEEQLKFHGWQQSLTAIPAISKMQEKFESMRAEEVRKASNKLTSLNAKEMEVVEKLSKGIVNKMLHGPMSALRQPEGPEEKKRTLSVLKSMFKLEKEFSSD